MQFTGSLPHVVVVGAGFGGLNTVRALRHAPVRVTLIDRENHHLFQPLLYQVATAALSASDIAVPTRSIFSKQRNAAVLLAEVTRVDVASRKVIFDGGEVPYDFLVLAAGSESSYFGHDAWEARAPSLKGLDDAIEIRRRVLLAFEVAEREPRSARRTELLTFAVIGGGPTGVELAGALSELARHVLASDFRSIDPRSATVHLVEAGPTILPAFDPDLSASALRQLEGLHVHVHTNTRVTNVEEWGIELSSGKRIAAATVIWAAGVRPSQLTQGLGFERDRAGRIMVGDDLSVVGHPEVFVVGDMAAFIENGAPLPGLSPVAIQEGRAAARAILQTLRRQERTAFHYRDKGTMATIGRSRAIAQAFGLHLSGLIAWVTWLVVHIWYLIGFRNRFIVMFDWAWSYFTYTRGARLITGLHPPPGRVTHGVGRREETPAQTQTPLPRSPDLAPR